MRTRENYDKKTCSEGGRTFQSLDEPFQHPVGFSVIMTLRAGEHPGVTVILDQRLTWYHPSIMQHERPNFGGTDGPLPESGS